MNPTHLRTFLAVQKRLSYTRAAEEVHLSQPAVSRQIQQLERDLGIRLFEQIGKSLHLTDAGRTLGAEAAKLLGSLERVAETVRAHRSPERGSLRIGASTTPGFYLLPEVLGRFHRRFPKVDLHYVVENSLRIEQKIVRNELDLGFIGAHPTNDDLGLTPLVEDEIICFAGSSHHLAKRRRIAPAVVAAETWVIREKGSATRRLFESWLASQKATMSMVIELSCPEACKALVRAGVGVSFMSMHALQSEPRQGHLKRLPITGLCLKRPISLVRHAEKRDSPVMEAFLGLVESSLGPGMAGQLRQ